MAALYAAITFATSPEPMLKLSEVEGCTSSTVKAPEQVLQTPDRHQKSFVASFISLLYEGVELSLNFRGVGWLFGRDSHIPIPHEPRNINNKLVFVLQTLGSMLAHYIGTDIVGCLLKMIPGVNTPDGGSIFAFGNNTFEKYAISMGISALSGAFTFFGESCPNLFCSVCLDSESLLSPLT